MCEGKGGLAQVTLQTEVGNLLGLNAKGSLDGGAKHPREGTVLFRGALRIFSSPHSERGERLRLIATAMITFRGRRKSRRENIKRLLLCLLIDSSELSIPAWELKASNKNLSTFIKITQLLCLDPHLPPHFLITNDTHFPWKDLFLDTKTLPWTLFESYKT